VAAARGKISLERIALNLDDESSPDNAGLVRSGRPIVRSGPVAYRSTLPLESMRRALDRRGFGAAISNHAGTYVCNHVFYVARHEIERMGSHASCGLIHVPAIRARGKNSKAHGMPLSRMVAAVECCIDILQKRSLRKRP
jgi:pyroglutamyl-peptidase